MKQYRDKINSQYVLLDELSREEDVLEWLVANKSTGDEEDVIEDVTSKTLNTLIGNIDNLVVLFCLYLFLIFNFICLDFASWYTLDTLLCLQMITVMRNLCRP